MNKKRMLVSFVVLASVACLAACGSSGSSSGGGSSDAAVAYAKFGENMNDAMPDGLKAGGANADVSAILMKELSGECAASYTDCPYITAAGGGDETSGDILMRLWALDYDDECTSAFIADGTCFDCADCMTGSEGTNFIKPTMIADPTACYDTSTTAGRYVNFGIDPCFFDTIVGQISNIAECETVEGGAVDISPVVPWYASWGIPQTINFSSYSSRDEGGGVWWTVNSGSAGNQQHFLSLDTNYLNAGIRDAVNDEFMFFGSGSPAYYAGRGEGSGVNISGYTGTLSSIPAQFEAIQVRVQDPNNYIERVKSNGSYLWYQSWSSSSFPNTPADVDAVKNSPDVNRCVQIGTSVVLSKYVPLTNCVTSFGAASVDALNLDSGYVLKVIDGQTANSINFSSELTPTGTSTCLEATEEVAE